MVTHVTAGPRSTVAAFSQRVFAELPRADQRRWAHAYVVSLLATPGKKSVRRLAATVSDSPTAFLSLHQFINSSPWDWSPVRAELARWATRRMSPQACVIDRAVLRKRGSHSCGAHSRFVASAGHRAICQVGFAAFLVTAEEAVPVDWRLLLPGLWGSDPAHRLRARIPDHVPAALPEHLVLDLADSLARATGDSALPVVADLPDDIDAAAVAHGLDRRRRGFLLAVPGTLPVTEAATAGHAALPVGPVVRVGSLVAPAQAGHMHVSAAVGAGRSRPGTVFSRLVHLPGPDARLPRGTYRILAVALPHERAPSRWWLTNLTRPRADTLRDLAGLTARAGHSLEALESGFGLADFGGRSYPGWHHHMTMMSAAYAYSRLGDHWDQADLTLAP
ncbi:IS701 family transposase [Streptomyces aureoverticillatus]|uniref:IS701 family transposase n=1 Tax=Streptomyces aureoverticillatus TaxID=66871 RepID=UPI0013DCDB11|nr:transposase [Streptomyces aureoverticillatus]QIB45412.1 transposase [Streptomyces aureoverticillatus]